MKILSKGYNAMKNRKKGRGKYVSKKREQVANVPLMPRMPSGLSYLERDHLRKLEQKILRRN